MLYPKPAPNLFRCFLMNKDVFLLGVALTVLAGGAGYHFYSASHAKPPAAVAPAAVAPGTTHAKAGAAAAAPASAPPKKPADATAQQQQAAAVQATRAPVEAALATMKVSSILLGDPAIVIISKQEYSVGDDLKLPGKGTLKVTAIGEDGVTLAASGQSYHLAAPAAPDLAASRKK